MPSRRFPARVEDLESDGVTSHCCIKNRNGKSHLGGCHDRMRKRVLCRTHKSCDASVRYPRVAWSGPQRPGFWVGSSTPSRGHAVVRSLGALSALLSMTRMGGFKRSQQVRHQGGGLSGIGGICLPKLGTHPFLLHAELDPEHEEDENENDEPAHLGDGNRHAKKSGQHAGVDGMAHHGIGTGGDQLVVLLIVTERLQLLPRCSRAQTAKRRPATVTAAPSQNGQ